MQCKILISIILILLVLTAGCSTLEKVVYHPDIDQGNYLSPDDVSKICVGMTQQQVSYILGTPMISDPFGTNTWFYVFRQHSVHKNIIQQILTLTFNSSGILIDIKNQFIFTK